MKNANTNLTIISAGDTNVRYNLEALIKSSKLKKISRIDSNKMIYKLLDNELKKSIHSLQILIE